MILNGLKFALSILYTCILIRVERDLDPDRDREGYPGYFEIPIPILSIPIPKPGLGIPTPNPDRDRDFFTLDKMGLAGEKITDLKDFEEKKVENES